MTTTIKLPPGTRTITTMATDTTDKATTRAAERGRVTATTTKILDHDVAKAGH